MTNRIKKVTPILKKIGVPVGVFNFDVSGAPLFKFSLEIDQSNVGSLVYNSSSEQEESAFSDVGPTGGFKVTKVDYSDKSSKNSSEPADTKEDKKDKKSDADNNANLEFTTDYPYTGPLCGWKSMPINSVRKANCMRDFALDNQNRFDSAHVYNSSSYFFKHSWLMAAVNQGGSNLFWTVQAASVAIHSLSVGGLSPCFCSESRTYSNRTDTDNKTKSTKPKKKTEPKKTKKDKTITGGGSVIPVGTVEVVGEALVTAVPLAYAYDGNLAHMAFFVSAAGDYTLLRVSVNGDSVYEPHNDGYLNPTLVENNTKFTLLHGGETQAVHPLLKRIYGNKTPAYRDWTVLIVENFPRDFIASGEYIFRCEITDNYVEDNVDETVLVSDVEIFATDMISKAFYVVNQNEDIELYNSITAMYDRTVVSDVSSIIDLHVAYNSNLMIYYKSGDQHAVRTYKDFFFDEYFEYKTDDKPLAMDAAFVNGGLQMAVAYEGRVDLVWNGRLEATFEIRGIPHTIFFSGAYYYIFTTATIYKIDASVRIVRSRWDVPSTHVAVDQHGAGYVLFDTNTGLWKNITLRGDRQLSLNWQRPTEHAPTGQIHNDVGTNGPYLYYASGLNLLRLDIDSGDLHVFSGLNTAINPLAVQYYDTDRQRIYVSGADNKIYLIAANEYQRDTVSLERILKRILIDGPEKAVDVINVPGLYGYVYLGDSGEIEELFSFFDLRASLDGDVTFITNKPTEVSPTTIELSSSTEQTQPQTNLLTRVVLKYLAPDEYGTSVQSEAKVYFTDRQIHYNVERQYNCSVFAHQNAMRLWAQAMLYTRRNKVFEHKISTSWKSLLIEPGDTIVGIGKVDRVTQSSDGIILRIIGDGSNEASPLVNFTDFPLDAIPRPQMGNRTEYVSMAVSPYFIQSSAIDRIDGEKNDMVYLSAVALLQNKTSLSGMEFQSEQVSASTFPAETVKHGKLISYVNNVETCGTPFTTDYVSEFTIEFSQNMGAELSSATYDQLLESEDLNMLLIGDELIQFVSVEFITDRIVRFYGGLFRGRRGTDIHTATHTAGERCFFMKPSAIVASDVLRAELNPGNSMEVTAQPTSDTFNIDRVRGTQDIYKSVNVKPWRPVSAHYLNDTAEPSFVWFNRYRHEVHFINNFNDIVQPGMESFRINDGFGGANKGFARQVIPTFYVLRSPYSADRLRTAKATETYPSGDDSSITAPYSNYIIREIPLARDFTLYTYLPSLMYQDGIIGEDITSTYFAVENSDELNTGKALGFRIRLSDVDSDQLISAQCVESV